MFGFEFCAKCHAEDDRCDHKVTNEDVIILSYVDSMPRFTQGNSVHRYGMFLVLEAARNGAHPPNEHEFTPTQVNRKEDTMI